MKNNPLWTERYRPQSLDECILPDSYREVFQKFIDNQSIPNLLLTGKPGIGKTTVAKALVKQVGGDSYVINGSLSGNIDTLRYDIKQFATTMSFVEEGRKYVILDEADYLNPNSTQPALRNFMEEYSSNCGFILTCNFPNKIIDPLKSRLSVIDFTIPVADKPKVALKFFKRVCEILDKEAVEYDKKVVSQVVTKYFPDFRKTLNELQRYSVIGKIDIGILSNFDDSQFDILVGFMKGNDYTSVRKWIAEHNDIEPHVLFRAIYDKLHSLATPQSIPQIVVTLGEYQYKSSLVVDQEINTAAALAEIMCDTQWKK